MRRTRPPTLIGFCFLAALTACSAKPRETTVKFVGQAPAAAFYADTRTVVEACTACAVDVGHADEKCGGCGARLKHAERVPCDFCRGSKKCDTCAAFETAGRCRFCGGSGKLDAAKCFGCAGSGACTACGGSADCDACGGSGTIALPWKASLPRARSVASGAPPAGHRVVWLDTEKSWEGFAPPRAVFRAEGGQRCPVAPSAIRPGSYLVVSGNQRSCVEVLELSYYPAGPILIGSGDGFPGGASTKPRIRDESVAWELSQGGSVRTKYKGEYPSAQAPGKGRWELTPVVEIPGLPPHRAARPLEVDVIDFRIAAPSAALAAGATVELRAESDPPIPTPSMYEWVVGAPGGAWSLRTSGPVVKVPLKRPGKHGIQVRCGEFLSSPLEISAFGVEAVDASGKPAKEASLALFEDAFDEQGKLRSNWPERAREQIRIKITDSDPAAPKSLTVATFAPDGTPLNAPGSATISNGATPPLIFVDDATDDVGDQTFLAAAGGRVEIFYRGAVALTLGVPSVETIDVPVRFVAVGIAGKTAADLKGIVDRRLKQANGVWRRFGIRFTRDVAEIAEPPRNLVLVTGRAAGVDERGEPARAALRVNTIDVSVPTYWKNDDGPMTPAATVRLLSRQLGRDWQIDSFENLYGSDPDALVVRLRSRAGGPATVEPRADGRDVGQTLTPIAVDLSDGCEVSRHGQTLSLDELGLLLGLKGEGLTVIVVGELRSATSRPALKAYPDWAFPAALAGAAIVVWNIMDDSDRYPYGLARALAETISPGGAGRASPRSLFAEPLSEKAAVDADKRVDAATGARVRDRARRFAARF